MTSTGARIWTPDGKSALDGVPSALELERHCGLRLRQMRRADPLLGGYDAMHIVPGRRPLESQAPT